MVQDTLTQNDWGACPIPAGWREHTDGSGCSFYYNKVGNQWATNYAQMFETEEAPAEEKIASQSPPLTQRSRSRSPPTSQESQVRKKARICKDQKPLNERHSVPREIQTQDLPGSEFDSGDRFNNNNKKGNWFDETSDEEDEQDDEQDDEQEAEQEEDGQEDEESRKDDDSTTW
jgi:hypothetical protein